MKRIKKRYVFGLALVTIIFAALYFAPTIARNYINENGEKLVGRKIKVGELHFNYARVALQIKDFTLYEADKKQPFVSFDELYINLDPTRLLKSELAFSQIKLVHPYVSVIQNDSIFNFNDIIAFFNKQPQSETEKTDSIEEPMRYSVSNFELSNGFVHYNDIKINSKFDLKNVGFKIPYIAWDSKKANMGIDFRLGEGDITIKSLVNPDTKDYQFSINSKNIAIDAFVPYLKDFVNINALNGKLYSDITLSGNYTEMMNVHLHGTVGLNDFDMVDNKNIRFLAAKNIEAKLDSIDVLHSHYHISKIAINEPYIYAELLKKGNNYDQILAPYYQTPSAPAPAAQPTDAKQEELYYKIDSVIIQNGAVQFKDLSLNRPFTYNINAIQLNIGGIYPNSTKMPVNFEFALNKSGALKGKAQINMMDTKQISTDFTFSNVDMISFSPYTEYYVGRPLTNGRLNYKCQLKMTQHSLKNENIILVKQVNFGKKTNKKPQINAPVMLGLYLLKDPKGNVDMNVPVTGNPSDPKFNYWKILWQALGNVFIKAASTPFNFIGQTVGIAPNPEEMKSLKYNIGQDTLTSGLRSKLDKIVELKQKKPQLSFNFTQLTGPEKEKQLLAIQATKRDMLLANNPTIEPVNLDALTEKVSTTDTAFVKYVQKRLNMVSTGTIDEACYRIQGEQKVNALFANLLQKRNAMISSYLTSRGLKTSDFTVITGDLNNLPEEQKDPKHLIEISFK